ncbi:hypothetical protein B0J15DRAFT_550666 [Fusarium solani]|uniref:DUF7730 domain-containing protein n=1 Tax=Fusarium solani TaxID=169388 RepID=A0A9P9H1A4_FUSSL|nr:uncharacterized protein B0J15DRAFT_550666 [Fusarium solani]KAH7249211.1 hypothetical protein B0J15DRAFT_550666 [Fusarium solani]
MPSVVFPTVGDQPKSPFFKKFPPEIRKMIYTELFGSRLVHVFFHSSAYLKPEFSYTREGAPPRRKISGWAHCVCQQGIEGPPHEHSEKHHKWCYLSASIIFTCKYAFEEGTPILYGSNSLSYSHPNAYWAFTDVAGRYLDLITNLNFSLAFEPYRHSPASYRGHTSPTLLLYWLVNLEASSLDCQIDMDPVDASLIKFAQEKVLADGPQFHFFLPNLARKSVEQKLRGGVGNNRVEIHWRSDESYSSTRLARILDTRDLWDEEYIHPSSG